MVRLPSPENNLRRPLNGFKFHPSVEDHLNRRTQILRKYLAAIFIRKQEAW
ncbi:hypothetical protein GCM10011389_41560 [Pontibacillus salipaludis]|uniref:Uncharacterized protein n=1 Tax=Pontibacillus salipaludis TaxID=1697394 RepID=A0ABQ1QJA8_9BACI|nr:hypothetical protein GCM10011389_41560 [Pontibacillus salipaludis]